MVLQFSWTLKFFWNQAVSGVVATSVSLDRGSLFVAALAIYSFIASRWTSQCRVYLAPCYSRCGLWTSSIDITWELIYNAESQTLARPAELESSLLFLFWFFLVAPCGLWDLSSPTRDRTRAMTMKAWNPNQKATRELPRIFIFKRPPGDWY